MTKFPKIAAAIQGIIDAVDTEVCSSDFRELTSQAACAEFAGVLTGTILPRRITIRSKSGSRLSVVVKNRRVIKIAEVHPLHLWDGDASPQDTACIPGYEEFGQCFAGALLRVIDGDLIAVEQAMISDPIGPSGHSGYPALLLLENVEQVSKGDPDADVIQQFYDAFSGQPRARFGSETLIDVPNGFAVDEPWMKAQLADARDDAFGKEGDLRFFLLDGDKPSGLALACLGDEGAIVVSEDAKQFGELEERLGALGARLRG